jgi:hypothetical protein
MKGWASPPKRSGFNNKKDGLGYLIRGRDSAASILYLDALPFDSASLSVDEEQVWYAKP